MKTKSFYYLLFVCFISLLFIFSPFPLCYATADGTVYEPRIYITETGSYYHSADCHYLRRSKIAIGLYQAKENGYSACSYCGGKPDGWDYFADSDYTAPDDAPSIDYPSSNNNQDSIQSNKSENQKNGWVLILEILSIFCLIAFFIILYAPHNS